MSGSVVATYVVLAEFAVSAEHKQEFLELCAYDSVRSVTDEPGCHHFDASVSGEDPEAVILYEVYTDEAAFAQHKASPHYAVFAAGVEKLGVKLTRLRMLTRQ